MVRRGWNTQDGPIARSWVLAIAGWNEGTHESELKQLSAELRIVDSVLYLGPKFGQDKVAVFQHCDVFILPSQSEGLPMAVLEAWSYGKLVVMTDQCNLPEGFAAQAALRIPNEVEGICHGLKQLFELTPAELEVMGRNGRQLVDDRFGWRRIGERFNEVCEWVLHGGTKPDCIHLD
jgi:poly(glycerol-phosphate) alpha-glucosyltransferase